MSDPENVAHAATNVPQAEAQAKKATMKESNSPPLFPTSDVKDYDLSEAEQQITAAGEAKYSRLSWKQLTLMLIVDAIALGALSIPQAFATLGMIAALFAVSALG